MRDATTLRAARRLRAVHHEAPLVAAAGEEFQRAATILDDDGDGWRAARVIRAIRARAAATALRAAREVQHA